MKSRNLKSKLGQNTAEYMLLLLLIGGASVAAFKMFGAGILNRFASVTSIITGDKAIDGKDVASDAETRSKDGVSFKTFDSEEDKK